MAQLSNLTELSLHQNQLTEVPKELAQLSNLTTLFLYQNQLTEVPKELAQLSNLTELFLHQNQLTEVPKELAQLSNLTKLSLHQNQLTEVPKELAQLSNLTELYLDYNQLVAVPECIASMTSLQRMDITNNALETLPHFLQNLPQLNTLLLHGNTHLRIPNAILGPTDEEVNNGAAPANPKDILEYYFRIQAAQKPLNEAKLILVGFGEVGKTSLINRLIKNSFDPKSPKTEGINITQWPMCLNNEEDITLHVWDFGGQDIMHSTHQFFLTERSLYLLVLNGRQGHEDTDAEYWLELIKSFGGDSPVILVLNKVKDHPFDVNRNDLKQKFPNIRDFILTDCGDDPIGLEALRTTIERETDQLPSLRDPFPASWFDIKKQLAGMSENYISFEEYRKICGDNHEQDSDAQNALATYLHDLGIVLNYRDDPRLQDFNVLNPLWVTNGIYKILNAHHLSHHKGELDLSQLEQILDKKDYPPERYSFLFELMRKFELCFRFQEDDTRYLVPDLLDKQQPPDAEDFRPKDCLNFRFQYPILPEGLLPRFIVRTHVLSRQQLRWRTGVILEFEGNQALIKTDRQERYVTINIRGPVSGRRRLLAIIRSDFERIHSSFKFTPKEQVPVSDYPNVILNYQDLLVMEKSREPEIPIVADGTLVKLNVQVLLRGIDLDDARKTKRESLILTKSLRLFYSYSHEDEALRDTLEKRLSLLKRQKLIQPWHDRRIAPGVNWKKELDHNLENANIILFLVSPDFIASDYCYEIEAKRALERHEAGEALVIPILIRPVNWDGLSFKHLQALPTDLKPVSQWRDEDNAWLNVEKRLTEIIQEKMNLRTDGDETL